MARDSLMADASESVLVLPFGCSTFLVLAILEDQETMNRKVLARFSDVCEKQFSSLGVNRDRIVRFLNEAMQG